ncbi:MAG: hypothetical protein HY429_00985 [Candidatus Levybacteria bacterium]|nr:hypothetical protein [Candidatus Levybacteria bacterium]
MNRYIFFVKERILNDKRNVIIVVILLVGLIMTIVFLQRQQIFRSRAYVNPDAFEVQDEEGNKLSPENGGYTTKTLKVKVKLTDPDKLSP